MSNRKYTLIIGGKPNRTHAADWLAGFIPAHWIHYENTGRTGTAWFCPVRLRGVLNDDKQGTTAYDNWRIMKKGFMNEFGFLCDIEKREIGWRFRLKDILNIGDMNRNRAKYLSYIPWFRKGVYPPFGGNPDGYKSSLHLWFVFSNLEKLKKPKEYSDFKVYANQYEKRTRFLTGNDFEGNTVFAIESPQIVKKDVDVDFSMEKGIDEYLKQFLITKAPKKPMREKIIQDIFLTRLLKEGFTPKKEVPIKRNEGRIDVLFEREERLIAVEIKRNFDDNSINQLKGYIKECKEEIGDKEIEGRILCGRKTNVLKENTEGYKIITYNLSLDFPRALIDCNYDA